MAKSPKYVYSLNLLTLSSRHAVDRAPTSQQPDARTSVPREELRREHDDRNPCSIYRTPADASAAPTAGLVGLLGSSSFVLPTVSGVLMEIEDDLGCCRYDSCCECRCGCEWEDGGDGAEDVEWECWGVGGSQTDPDAGSGMEAGYG